MDTDNATVREYRSTLDSVYPFVIQHWLLCFRCDYDAGEGDAIERVSRTLKEGMDATVRQMPFLAGHLEREDRADAPVRNGLVLVYNSDDQVKVHINKLSQQHDRVPSYHDLVQKEMPVADLEAEELFHKINDDGHRSLSVQANFLDGGCIVAIRVHHSLFDGIGAAQVVGVWAANCRQLSCAQSQLPAGGRQQRQQRQPQRQPQHQHGSPACLQVPPVVEQQKNAQPLQVQAADEDRLSWNLLGLRRPQVRSRAVSSTPGLTASRISTVFHAPTSKLRGMRDEVQRETGVTLSTFDVMAALLWRCVMRSRTPDMPPGEEYMASRLRIPTDVRRTLNIPADYLGNVLVNSVSEETLQALISATSLGDVAVKVARAKHESRSPDNVLAAVEVSRALPSVKERSPLFADTIGPDLVLTSWQRMPFCTQDWGGTFGAGMGGRPEFLRIPRGHLAGVCAVLPSTPDACVTSVLISSTEAQLKRLSSDAEFIGIFRQTIHG